MPNVNIDVMRARLAEIEDVELRAIDSEAGSESLNEAQQTRWDALDTEATEVRANIAKAEQDARRDEQRAEQRARWSSLQVAPVADRSDLFDLGEVRSLQGDALIDRARSAFDPEKARGGQSEAAAEVARKIELFSDAESDDAANLARYALVHGSDAYRSAFKTWMRAASRGNAPVLSQGESDAVRASMSLTSGTGGYALPTLLDPTLIHTGTQTKNPIRRISRVVSGTQDKWHGVTVGNVTTYWKPEGAAFTEGSPTLGPIEIDAAMLTAYVTGSFEIFQDSNLFSQLPGLIGEAIDMAEGVAFITGSGSDAPRGVVTAVSGTAGSLVTATTRGAFTSASGVDTLALYNSLPARYEDNATFVMNKLTYINAVAQQTYGTAGGRVVDLAADQRILDTEVVRVSGLPSATTSGNILAVLGDFSQYIVYDRLGLNVEFIQNVVDGDGLPVGKRGLVAYKRVGGDVADVNAFRLLKA